MPEPKRVSDSQTEQMHLITYSDLNSSGRLFGGKLLSWIDEVAGATARRHCGRDVTTVAIDNTYFKAGAFLGDMIVLIGRITGTGRTSMEIRIDTYIEASTGVRTPINRAYFVMVAVDEKGNTTEVPRLITETESQRMELENFQKRRELRLMRKKEGY